MIAETSPDAPDYLKGRYEGEKLKLSEEERERFIKIRIEPVLNARSERDRQASLRAIALQLRELSSVGESANPDPDLKRSKGQRDANALYRQYVEVLREHHFKIGSGLDSKTNQINQIFVKSPDGTSVSYPDRPFFTREDDMYKAQEAMDNIPESDTTNNTQRPEEQD